MNQNHVLFSQLRVEGWRQFGRVEIDLHPRLTVITGANGAGKSSLLRIFSRHFGYDRGFLATPRRDAAGNYSYQTGLFSETMTRIWRSLFPIRKQSMNEVGHLIYNNGVDALLNIPYQANVQFSLNINGQQAVSGIHIDSHQTVSHFRQVESIPTTFTSAQTAYSNYNNELTQKFMGGHTNYSPMYRMKEAIISMAFFGEGNAHVQGNSSVKSAYLGFIDTLRRILPESLGFIDLSIRPPEVVMVTRSGEFIIDAASGGIMTLIDLAWRLYMFSLNEARFVVTMDEPENHLHPTMQKTLMSKLLAAFPQAQFIIATHSPFMVSSVRDSTVYALRYWNTNTGEVDNSLVASSDTSRVYGERLDTVNRAGNASEILREVLGVTSTTPEWVADGVSNIVGRYRNMPINGETLHSLRRELEAYGYDDMYPDALASLTAGR